MVGIKENSRLVKKVESELVGLKGKIYGGEVRKNDNGLFFYRKNKRYSEVSTGVKGRHYGFLFDPAVLLYIYEKGCDYIYIETQFNLWEIDIDEFIEKSRRSKGQDKFLICSEVNFVMYQKNEIPDDEKYEEEHKQEPPEAKPNEGSGSRWGYKDNDWTKNKVDKMNKEAEERVKKKKAENPQKEEQKPKKKYKEGEQTQLF